MFRFVGNGFLYNMVRILVGTLLEVGSGQRSPDDIPRILTKRSTVCWKNSTSSWFIFMGSILLMEIRLLLTFCT